MLLIFPHLCSHVIAFSFQIFSSFKEPFALRILRSVTIPCIATFIIFVIILEVIVGWPLFGAERERTILILCDLEVSLWSRFSIPASCITVCISFNEKVVAWLLLGRNHPVSFFNIIHQTKFFWNVIFFINLATRQTAHLYAL